MTHERDDAWERDDDDAFEIPTPEKVRRNAVLKEAERAREKALGERDKAEPTATDLPETDE